MGIIKPIDLNSNRKGVIFMSKLYAGIDVGNRNNVVYLMKPDGSKQRALALTARKFVCLVYTLLIDNKLYTPSEL